VNDTVSSLVLYSYAYTLLHAQILYAFKISEKILACSLERKLQKEFAPVHGKQGYCSLFHRSCIDMFAT